MTFFPSHHTSFFDSYCDLLVLILPYFAFVLPFSFPFFPCIFVSLFSTTKLISLVSHLQEVEDFTPTSCFRYRKAKNTADYNRELLFGGVAEDGME
jgi:phosphatidylglycerophosphate synthase